MRFSTFSAVILSAVPFLLSLPASTNAHSMIIAIHGSNKVEGRGFGVALGRPRFDGMPGDSGADASQFIDEDIAANRTSVCGRTPLSGNNVVQPSLQLAESRGLPAAFPNRSVVFELFQVNADGGGPYICEISPDGTGKAFKPIPVTLNVPGTEGIHPQTNTNMTMVATIPSGVTCTGGNTKKACLLRCRGGRFMKFGSCFAVQTASESSATPPNAVTAAVRSALAQSGLSNATINRAGADVARTLTKQGYLLSFPVPKAAGRREKRHKAQKKRSVVELESLFEGHDD